MSDMPASVRCPNERCPEHAIDKITDPSLDVVRCGACWAICVPGDDVPLPDWMVPGDG